MAIKPKVLGKLTRVDLRDFWEDEARDFTPWLAEAENLTLLGDTIGLELELVGREQSVGGFKVDILARDTVSNRYVVIENQLERTNHGHLGQLLTYGSGYDAVWVAKHICDEHRKALDWLNEKTSEDVAFFGLEMELWQIGDSIPAPKFSLVSQPNEWGRTVDGHRKTAATGHSPSLADRQFSRERFDRKVDEGRGHFVLATKPPALESLSPGSIVGYLVTGLKMQSLPGATGKLETLHQLYKEIHKLRSLFEAV